MSLLLSEVFMRFTLLHTLFAICLVEIANAISFISNPVLCKSCTSCYFSSDHGIISGGFGSSKYMSISACLFPGGTLLILHLTNTLISATLKLVAVSRVKPLLFVRNSVSF